MQRARRSCAESSSSELCGNAAQASSTNSGPGCAAPVAHSQWPMGTTQRSRHSCAAAAASLVVHLS